MKSILSSTALASIMQPRARTSQSIPDRQFFLWVLTGLIAATIGSGITAMTVALAIGSGP